MAEVTWSQQASEDLTAISDYISVDSFFYAQKQVSLLISKSKTLKAQPLKGHIVHEIANPRIREILVGKYRMIYQLLDGSNLQILTIHHSSRLLKINICAYLKNQRHQRAISANY